MREVGYYWVKLGDEFEVGYWSGMFWLLTDSENHFEESEFIEIDENRIVRNE